MREGLYVPIRLVDVPERSSHLPRRPNVKVSSDACLSPYPKH